MNKQNIYTQKKNIIILAVICCLLWGSAYPAVKIGYNLFNIDANDIGSKLLFAGIRFFLAGIFVLSIILFKDKKELVLNKKEIFKFTTLGIMQTFLQYIFFYIGLSYTTGVRGSLINGMGTFFILIFAHITYNDDKIKKRKIIGSILGFIGIVIISVNGDSLFDKGFTFLGEGFVLISTIFSSLASIYSKNVSQNKNVKVVTGYQLAIGGLLLILSGVILGGKLTNYDYTAVLLLIYMALISSVAFSIWTELLKNNKASKIAIYNFLIPVFGVILSGIFLREDIFDIKIILVLIIVCIGIYIGNKQNK